MNFQRSTTGLKTVNADQVYSDYANFNKLETGSISPSELHLPNLSGNNYLYLDNDKKVTNSGNLASINQNLGTSNNVTFASCTLNNLGANEVVISDGQKKLVSEARKSAFNCNFGNSSTDVPRGNWVNSVRIS